MNKDVTRSARKMNAGWIVVLLFGLTGSVQPAVAEPASCKSVSLGLQVLGSGGPELDDHRASSGYLIWRNGKAQVLIDLGPGSLLRYEQSGARFEDLEVVLLTHLHVDHSGDLPALLKGSYFTSRTTELPIYGPTGNARYPATHDFVKGLFGSPGGAFAYLGDYLTGEESYRLIPHEVLADGKKPVTVLDFPAVQLDIHGLSVS